MNKNKFALGITSEESNYLKMIHGPKVKPTIQSPKPQYKFFILKDNYKDGRGG